MKRRHKRLLSIIILFFLLSSLTFLILTKLKENISFFYTVSEVVELPVDDRIVRIGGMVVQNSVLNGEENKILFKITDFNNEIEVEYSGMLPPMFTEKNGVVAKGKLVQGKIFVAEELFAKHDEKYMPKKYTIIFPKINDKL